MPSLKYLFVSLLIGNGKDLGAKIISVIREVRSIQESEFSKLPETP